MGVEKNYQVVLIEPLSISEYENGRKVTKFFLNIKVELKDYQISERIDVGSISILDEKGICVERPVYNDQLPHHPIKLGGAEKYHLKDFCLPISEQAYKQVKQDAIICFTVEEDGNRHQEELIMKNGLYSNAMADKKEEEK